MPTLPNEAHVSVAELRSTAAALGPVARMLLERVLTAIATARLREAVRDDR